MSDLINRIKHNQMIAGENAVIESLKAKGLIPKEEFINHSKCKLDRSCHRNLNKDCNYYCQYFDRT